MSEPVRVAVLVHLHRGYYNDLKKLAHGRGLLIEDMVGKIVSDHVDFERKSAEAFLKMREKVLEMEKEQPS
jgi:hypothetical protein